MPLLLLGALALASASPADAQPAVEIRVESGLAPEARDRIAPRAAVERCVLRGARRVDPLGGSARFQVRWHRGALIVVLVESTLGEHSTDDCVRRVLASARALLRRELPPGELVSVLITAPTHAPLCNPDGTEVSSGRQLPACAHGEASRATTDQLRRALESTRVRPRQTLAQSCGFTQVTVWLDAGGRLVAYGASSVNGEGESPALDEYPHERAAALQTLGAHRRAPGPDAGALRRVVFRLGGCD